MRYLLLIICIVFSTSIVSARTIEEEIKEFAQREWPNDYRMQEHVYKKQLKAYRYMQTVNDKEIKSMAIQEWPGDYKMQQHVYDKQVASKKRMGSVKVKKTRSYDKHKYNTPLGNGTSTYYRNSNNSSTKTRNHNPQKSEIYVESQSNPLDDVRYIQGNIITLFNRNDSSFAIYKDEDLTNITTLFSNGVKATIKDLKTLPDKRTSYKVQLTLGDGSIYDGWVPASSIKTNSPKKHTRVTRSPKVNTRQDLDTSLDVNPSVKFDGQQFTIRNKNSSDWNDVTMYLNGKGFSMGYSYKARMPIEAGETYRIGAMQFTKSNGERFNPFTHKPKKLFISCTMRGEESYGGVQWE